MTVRPQSQPTAPSRLTGWNRPATASVQAVWPCLAAALLLAGTCVLPVLLAAGENTPPNANNVRPAGFLLAAQAEQPAANDNSDTHPGDAAANGGNEANEEGETEEEAKLPKLTEMELPTAARLLQEPPVDWVVLRNDDVLVCQPVYPRPRTLEQIQQRIDDSLSWPRAVGREAFDLQKRRRLDLYYIDIFLPEEETEEGYRLHRRYIQEIIHHEDLMLRQAAQLIRQDNLLTAWELLFALHLKSPYWPGLRDHQNLLLFRQAEAARAGGRPAEAVVYLEELAGLDSGYSGLKTELGAAVEQLVAEAAGESDWRRARHFLRRLGLQFNQHPVKISWSAELNRQAQHRIQRALAAREQGQLRQAADQLELAARIWPETEPLPEAYRSVLSQWPRLHVGLVVPAGAPPGWFLPDRATETFRSLSQPQLFEIDAVDALPHDHSDLLTYWEPADLGRRATFTLRQTRSPRDPVPLVSAAEVVRTLQQRTAPGNPRYDERLHGFLKSARVLTPRTFELTFTRAPRRIEALLRFPIPGVQRFVPQSETTSRPAWLRAIPEPGHVATRHVAEIIEHRYPTTEAAVRALLREEITCLPHLPPEVASLLREDGRFTLQRAGLPVNHTIQFNPASPVVLNRELRRALAAAVDRQKILSQISPGGSPRPGTKIVSAPFASQFRGTSPLVTSAEADPALAAGLSVVAAKELSGGLPELRLLVEPGELTAEVAGQLIAAWERVGLKVRQVQPDEAVTRESGWDLLYRTSAMTDPAAQLWPWLTFRPTAEVDALTWLPHWIRQRLIALEYATDEQAANLQLNQLHHQLRDEAWVIPLWEIEEYTALRKTIRGYAEHPVTPLQHLSRWTIQPSYSRTPAVVDLSR